MKCPDCGGGENPDDYQFCLLIRYSLDQIT